MLEVSNLKVYNIKDALRGARNPLESWHKSDTVEFLDGTVEVGTNDLQLAQKLIKAGSDHSKFMRQVLVSMDITGPRYWWAEMDTYKVATVANSTSTMHKLAHTPITIDCFSIDNADEVDPALPSKIEIMIDLYEELRLEYLRTKDKKYWRALIQLLPASWNQTRTWTANYAVLRNIYLSRKNHKLEEWHDFIDLIKLNCPYAEELICLNSK